MSDKNGNLEFVENSNIEVIQKGITKEKRAEELLNEWVKAWGSNQYKTFDEFYGSTTNGMVRMNLEAFAFFVAEQEAKAVVKAIEGERRNLDAFWMKKMDETKPLIDKLICQAVEKALAERDKVEAYEIQALKKMVVKAEEETAKAIFTEMDSLIYLDSDKQTGEGLETLSNNDEYKQIKFRFLSGNDEYKQIKFRFLSGKKEGGLE